MPTLPRIRPLAMVRCTQAKPYNFNRLIGLGTEPRPETEKHQNAQASSE